jgi:hypothetical protein
MRRTLAAVACVIAILGLVAPPVFAQVPAPKVTITGLFDQITSAGANFYDGNFVRTADREWYARTRFRPDMEFAVGRTKAVLGIEFDITYGNTGVCGAGPGKTIVSGGAGAVTAPCPGEKPGATASAGLNTDVTGIFEVKWMYTEFDLTGKDSLLPFIPVATVARAGLQPFATLGSYRATYAAGDFAGISAVSTFAPNLKSNLAFVMVEDELATTIRGTTNPVGGTRITRGKDYAVIASPELTPFKGLDIKPVYSYFHAEGTTSNQARRSAANVGSLGGNIAGAAALGGSGVGRIFGDPLFEENRHTVGLDARWRAGPFSFDPTVMYQWGNRDSLGLNSEREKSDVSAYLIDLQGGFQAGPLLLEARAIYSTGNNARDNLAKSIRYYEPLDLDTNYYITWAQIFALGVDYFNGSTMNGMAQNVGYDRYGRAQLGGRATYSLTPALAIYGIVSPTWTAKKVDTDTGSNGTIRTTLRQGSAKTNSWVEGDSRFLGTELDLGTTWRFAPNVAFDLVGGYLFAGHALDVTECQASSIAAPACPAGQLVKRDAKDAWTSAARVRLSF